MIPKDHVMTAKTSVSSYFNCKDSVYTVLVLQVYEVLLAKTNTHNFDDKASYPHVRTLLQFDTREFLNVIALV